ncbi:MAG: damage-inducible protein CinA [Moritella sp.]|uniref:CinA family nicotinamide mononucleotide deamidase-related protein n=1 Tax=unclassified Moritella TaxID=2637987 RepID=UPI0001569B76|nr:MULTISPECIES: CinA family nicotinamide mononucleotide deamidase-related protein [unclassified Moritella]EDM65145.1 competence/damage-inducible protein CinA [Moritella sp. PE36]MBL1415415.1 CinA family nicotinamide mononucleotide deamidase-related protein [Moritella sp.]PHR89832.1 MAG: damage-inducible protein CinA [Moritella sp.]
MRIEFISTGDEVLSGQIVDTNAAWISQHFFHQGRQFTRRHTVADDLDSLIDIITETSHRADVVIMNGGLGPTSDDLSAEAAAKAMGVPLTRSQAWYDHLVAKYAKSNRSLSVSNEKQAWLPQGSEVVDNPVGTACGFSFQFNRARFYFTPGVPSEFKHMVTEQILPDIQQRFTPVTIPTLIKIKTFGISESTLNEQLCALNLPDTITLGFRVDFPTVEVKLLSTHAADLQKARLQVLAELDKFVLMDGDGSFAQYLQKLMLERGHTLSLAESCTGGLIASELIAVAGSSGYLDSSHVTYSNESKCRLVNVDKATLDKHGAVSIEVAAEMAEGAMSNAGVDFGIAVSGIAGPGGGSEAKPVGTVAFALASKTHTYSQLLFIPRWSRQGIRTVALYVALDMLRRELLGLDLAAEFGSLERRAEQDSVKG